MWDLPTVPHEIRSSPRRQRFIGDLISFVPLAVTTATIFKKDRRQQPDRGVEMSHFIAVRQVACGPRTL